jgi:hypothetical protein
MSDPAVIGSITELGMDARGQKIQDIVPDPAKSQVNANMTGTITFVKGSGGAVDITGWLAIKIDPTADGTYYFNSDSTKTYPVYTGVSNVVFVQRVDITQVTFVLGAATASVQGM